MALDVAIAIHKFMRLHFCASGTADHYVVVLHFFFHWADTDTPGWPMFGSVAQEADEGAHSTSAYKRLQLQSWLLYATFGKYE